MSIPKSKMLGVSKGFLAIAKLKNNSPSQSQNVCVNVQLPPDKNKEMHQESVEPVEQPHGECTVCYSESPPSPVPEVLNPYQALPKERSIESANLINEDLNRIIVEKDKICRALLLMLDIVESNPLIVNKYIIAEAESLKELVMLLTNSDEVSFQSDLDMGCGCSSNKYVKIDKIHISKNNETYNFKYAFPDAVKILDDHHISMKYCI